LRILDSVARVISRLNIMPLALALLFCILSPAPSFAKNEKKTEEQGSLYELTSSWTDHKGQKFTWKDLQGKVALVSMVYTSCGQTCPLIISELSALQKALPQNLQKKVEVLIFSFDPARDTQEHLAAYAKERKLNPDWRLLRAPEEDVQELAAVLSVRYKKMESGDYAHSNIFTVVGPKGQIRHQQMELFRGRPETVAALRSLIPSD
jgi:protein SCO1/2